MKRLRTGIFSGSFDPIHIGHLALANYLCEFEDLDEVWFVVSPQNPFKKDRKMAPEEWRMRLIQEATRPFPKFKACEVELHLPRPSYTITTLDYLRHSHPDRDFVLIIGADNWLTFTDWKDADRLLQEFEVLIYPRKGYEIDSTALPQHIRISSAPLMEISSTFIREAIQQGKDVRYFLHESTHRLIIENKGYIEGSTWE